MADAENKDHPGKEDQPGNGNAGDRRLERKQTEDLAFDMLDVLSAPVLTAEAAWADSIPERLRNIVGIARMVQLKNNVRTATYVEGVMYLYTATLTAPVSNQIARIYNHLTCTTLQDWFNQDVWDLQGAPRTLSEADHQELDKLLRHIYDKRREILKERIKQEKKNAIGDQKKRRR